MKAFIDWRGNRPQYAVFKWRNADGGYETITPVDRITGVAEAKRHLNALNERLAAQKLGRQCLLTGSMPMTAVAAVWGDSHLHRSYRPLVLDFAARFCKDGGITKPEQITPVAVLAWRAKSNKADQHRLRLLATMLRWAVSKLKIVVDPEAIDEMSGTGYGESDNPLLTPAQYERTMVRADSLGQAALAHCLSVYGWRPMTAALLTVGDIRPATESIRLRVKGHETPFEHPLFDATMRLLMPLTSNRRAGDPMFVTSTGLSWVKDQAYAACRMNNWYGRCIKPMAPDAGGIYAWKRWAITAMHRGLPPWPRKLDVPEIQLFTGHRTKVHVLRYLRTSESEARELVGKLTDAAGSVSGSKPLPMSAQDGYTRPTY